MAAFNPLRYDCLRFFQLEGIFRLYLISQSLAFYNEWRRQFRLEDISWQFVWSLRRANDRFVELSFSAGLRSFTYSGFCFILSPTKVDFIQDIPGDNARIALLSFHAPFNRSIAAHSAHLILSYKVKSFNSFYKLGILIRYFWIVFQE